PFLGICLGMQLLFDESEESPGVKGLSLLPGRCIKIPDDKGLKVPQIGWNSLDFPNESRLLSGVSEGSFVYFVHSYYIKAKNISDVAATTEYGVTVHAAVEHDNIYGCQFHPEKSSEVGLKILKNFAEL
ncbi:MAG: imidazole glycerol phosphate synthase subunit HisH, partial [Lachnospiraceae bacterium]|nr:imidazole glycerol phosphate synthase subunit HisH [Lachnospiraceae bacterium]